MKAIDPQNEDLVTLTPPDWVPSNEAIQRIEGVLQRARSATGPAPQTNPEPDAAAILGSMRARVPDGGFGSITDAYGVTIPVSGDSRQALGLSYEQGIRDVFGSAKRDGTFIPEISRDVDDLFEGQVFEAKHTNAYMTSIYNPDLSSKSWQQTVFDRLIRQASAITNAQDDGAIYFTNDRALAEGLTELFRANGIWKFRFIIAPSMRQAKP